MLNHHDCSLPVFANCQSETISVMQQCLEGHLSGQQHCQGRGEVSQTRASSQTGVQHLEAAPRGSETSLTWDDFVKTGDDRRVTRYTRIHPSTVCRPNQPDRRSRIYPVMEDTCIR